MVGVDKLKLIKYNKNMEEKKDCPRCGSSLRQNNGKSQWGSQRAKCLECGKFRTINPKKKGYSEEVRTQAIKLHFAGASGRTVGKVMGMSKANVYNWAKKKP